MDYTQQLKEEIIDTLPKQNSQRFAFLASLTKNLAVVQIFKKGIQLVYEIEDKAQAIELFGLIREFAEGDVFFEQRGANGEKVYKIQLKDDNADKLLEKLGLSRYSSSFVLDNGVEFLDKLNEEDFFAYFKGLVYACGRLRFAGDDYDNYSLILTFGDYEYCSAVAKKMAGYNIELKHNSNKTGEVLISRNSSDIQDMLAMCGASKSVLTLNDILVKREEENAFNRMSNCLMANFIKTLESTQKYTKAIEILQNTGKFELLDEKLKAVAIAKTGNPEDSMQELAQRLNMSKTSVSRALNKILAMAEEENGRE